MVAPFYSNFSFIHSNFSLIFEGKTNQFMDSDIAILVVFLVFSAVFSGSETALVSLTGSKVDEMVAQKVKNSRLLKKLKSNPHRLLITVLIGNNIVNVGASAYAAVVFTEMFGSSGVGIATGVMTFLILIFGEITPKSFAHQHAASISLLIAKPVYILQTLFFPIVWAFEKVVHAVNRLFGTNKSFTVTEGELVAMLKIGAQEGSIEKQERELIENVLEFNDIEVEEVMTPRVIIEALDCEMTIKEAVNFVIKHTHSRIPVYRDNLDNIIGIISIKDLLKYYDKFSANKKLKNLKLTPPLEVPFSKKINNLFREFQRKHVHIAIVIDEFGGTAGLVTLEDLLEEIVGDIVDESDVAEKPLEIIDKRTILAKGSALIEDINDHFKAKLWSKERDSVSSLLVDHLHRFPREGEVVKFPKARVYVLKMQKNTVERVKIVKARKPVKRKKL